MSGPLDPRTNSGTPFAQQGQVDWVALGKHSVSFTIDTLLRLSRAGVDPITFEMGRVVCRDLTLGPLAQKRVHEALSTLQSFSSYGKVIWLGFGVRHIVHDLASTEQGMTCVAICAALRVSYHTFFAATFLRELSRRRGAPDGLLPALQQWEALLHVCTGALSASKFPRLVDGFSRILAPSTTGKPIPRSEPTNPVALAQALCLVSDVARGYVASCTFAGGIDCAWLAALAEWLYCLCVEIRSDASSEVLYRTSAGVSGSTNIPQVIMLRSEDSLQPTSVLSKAFILPRGMRLIYPGDLGFQKASEFEGFSPQFERRSDWSHILADTFGDAICTLLQGPTGESFAYLLGYNVELGRRRKEYLISDSELRDWPAISFLPNSGWEAFLDFAGRCLPELQAILKGPGMRRGTITYSESKAHASASSIRNKCGCSRCVRHPRFPRFCLEILAWTIIYTLELLHGVIVHPDVLPSVRGLLQTYLIVEKSWSHYYPFGPPEKRMFSIETLSIYLQDLLRLFTPSGEYEDGKRNLDTAAFSANGLCAFYQLLQDPWLSPLDAAKIILIPGHIEYQSARFSAVQDIKVNPNNKGDVGFAPDWMNGKDIQLDFIVEETIRSNVLAGAYRLQKPTFQGRTLTDPQVQTFGVASTALASRCRSFRAICQESSRCLALTSRENAHQKWAWTLKWLTAETHDQEMAENEQKVPPQSPDQLRRSVGGSQRNASWSIFKVSFDRPLSGYDRRIKIHQHSFSPSGSKEFDRPNANSFPTLYAELAELAELAEPMPPLLGYYDDCIACIPVALDLVADRFLTTIVPSRREIFGSIFRHSTGDWQTSEEAEFVLEPHYHNPKKNPSSDLKPGSGGNL